MEKISEAVLKKVTTEAKDIVDKAKGEAKEKLDKANIKLKLKLEKEKQKKLQEAEEESARISSRVLIKTRHDMIVKKSEELDTVIEKVKERLVKTPMSKKAFLGIAKESLESLHSNEVRIYVPKSDLKRIKGFIKEEKELHSKVKEVKEGDFVGGFIMEDLDGSIRIDNTYAARLEMLLPRIKPEITRDLF